MIIIKQFYNKLILDNNMNHLILFLILKIALMLKK